MEINIKLNLSRTITASLLYFVIFVKTVVCWDACGTKECENGCCGTNCCTYEVSKIVLIVACVVSGLILLVLIAAIFICCYKNYKNKQSSRVRQLRQEQDHHTPRLVAEPPKPPSYVSAPPAYSEEMPESHFRPPTVSGYNNPCNQRFMPLTVRTINTATSGTARVSATNSSGQFPIRAENISNRGIIQGIVPTESPPPYREFIRGQTPAHRRQRFIRTPVVEDDENANHLERTVVHQNNEFSRTAHIGNDARQININNAVPRTQETRANAHRNNESRVESSRAQQSRATVQANAIIDLPGIPTPAHGTEL